MGDQPVSHEVSSRPEDVVAYWTEQRRAQARPRHNALDPPGLDPSEPDEPDEDAADHDPPDPA